VSGIEIKNIPRIPREISRDPGEKSWKIIDIFTRDIKLFDRNFSDRRKEKFYSELAILITAGIDIKSAFEIIVDQLDKQVDKTLIGSLKDKVISGITLSTAMESTGMFSAYEFYSIRIGEESGRLTEVLKDLASFFSGKIQQKRQFMNALSYPTVVVITAMGAVYFMMRFVVPMFADVFRKFDTDLPALTKIVLNTSHFVAAYGFYFFICIALLILLIYQNRGKTKVKKWGTAIILKIPFIGQLVRKLYLSRLCHSLFLLTSSKIPLLDALDLVEKMVSFYPITISLKQVREQIMTGNSLNGSLSPFKIYDKRFIAMIKIGEEANQLDAIFDKLSMNYSDDVKYQTGLVVSMLEPLMIIFLGLFVAIILVSMYLPLFRLSSGIGL